MLKTHHPVVLYDGVCNVCDASVQFILDHDREGLFHFASLQSNAGRELASSVGVDASEMDTLVLVIDGKGLVRSDAVLGIARRLGPPWTFAAIFRILPHPVRDLAYRIVSMNRTHWFGQRAACRIPTPDVRDRFLDL